MTTRRRQPKTRPAREGEPSKVCCDCGPERGPLSLTSFTRNSGKPDGLNNQCKDCHWEWAQAHAQQRRASRTKYQKKKSREKRANPRLYGHTTSRDVFGARPGYRERVARFIAGETVEEYTPDVDAARVRVAAFIKGDVKEDQNGV